MRINGAAQAYTPNIQASQTDLMRQAHQVKVLKKALESQTQAADQLLKMLEPKGRNLDIRA